METRWEEGNCESAHHVPLRGNRYTQARAQATPTLPLFPAIAILTDRHLGRHNLGTGKPLQEGGRHYPQSCAGILIVDVTSKLGDGNEDRQTAGSGCGTQCQVGEHKTMTSSFRVNESESDCSIVLRYV